jgi:hypothetical protein
MTDREKYHPSTRLTTQGLDATRTKYGGEIIPAVSVMDAETQALLGLRD